MTTDEKWEKIVSLIQTKQSAKESEVEDTWTAIFSELFGYSKIDEEIERQRNITIGSSQRAVPDIIIRNGKTDLFIVELKQHNLPFDDKYKEQLFSYMLLLKLKVGILICDKIYVYYGNDSNALHMKIAFERGNPQGSKFVELFNKGNFSENAVKTFIEKHSTLQSEVQAIRADLQRVSINDIIRQYYKPQYSEEAIELALKDLRVEVTFGEKRQKSPEHNSNASLAPAKNSPKGKYECFFTSPEGRSAGPYGLGELVFNVVDDYVRSHPATTRTKLEQEIFRKEIQGSLGVVVEVEMASQRCKDYYKRFFIDNPIQLADGAIYVCKGWEARLKGDEKSGNIYRFVAAAKERGYIIKIERMR